MLAAPRAYNSEESAAAHDEGRASAAGATSDLPDAAGVVTKAGMATMTPNQPVPHEAECKAPMKAPKRSRSISADTAGERLSYSKQSSPLAIEPPAAAVNGSRSPSRGRTLEAAERAGENLPVFVHIRSRAEATTAKETLPIVDTPAYEEVTDRLAYVRCHQCGNVLQKKQAPIHLELSCAKFPQLSAAEVKAAAKRLADRWKRNGVAEDPTDDQTRLLEKLEALESPAFGWSPSANASSEPAPVQKAAQSTKGAGAKSPEKQRPPPKDATPDGKGTSSDPQKQRGKRSTLKSYEVPCFTDVHDRELAWNVKEALLLSRSAAADRHVSDKTAYVRCHKCGGTLQMRFVETHEQNRICKQGRLNAIDARAMADRVAKRLAANGATSDDPTSAQRLALTRNDVEEVPTAAKVPTPDATPKTDSPSPRDSSQTVANTNPDTSQSGGGSSRQWMEKFVPSVSPQVRCFTMEYLDTVGVPFLLGSRHCGVWFKDSSCILIDASSVITYVSRRRYRFSIRPPTRDAKLTVPKRLERKFLALLWCRDVFAHEEKRGAFGFIDAKEFPDMLRESDASKVEDRFAEMAPAPGEAPPFVAQTVLAAGHVGLDGFLEACTTSGTIPLNALRSAAGGDADRALVNIHELLPPFPLYVSRVVSSNSRVTFVLSNESRLYPDHVYCESESDSEAHP